MRIFFLLVVIPVTLIGVLFAFATLVFYSILTVWNE